MTTPSKPFTIDKREVYEAYLRVRSNGGAAGVDGTTLDEFETDLKGNLYRIWNRMSSGAYFPPPVRAVPIPKKSGGQRILGVPTVADRVAQTVVKQVIEPILDAVFLGNSYGYRPTVPVLAKGKTVTGRLWTYVRDDRPFGGAVAPGAIFYYSRDRGGEHPCRHLAGYAGILQADAYAGFNDLYDPRRKPGPIIEAACWSHGRRKLFVLADVAKSPLAIEAVSRIDAIFEVERELNGRPAAQRLLERRLRVAPLVFALEHWMRGERGKLSRHAEVAKAMDYMLKRWEAFTRFLDDGRICLSNNAAERALRGIALGRKAWLFAGSDRGGERAAAMYSLIVSAKLNDIDPRAWLADVLARIGDHPASRLEELLPWQWPRARENRSLAA